MADDVECSGDRCASSYPVATAENGSDLEDSAKWIWASPARTGDFVSNAVSRLVQHLLENIRSGTSLLMTGAHTMRQSHNKALAPNCMKSIIGSSKQIR